MKIVILRTNTSDFGKIGTYNVQEVGLAKSLINKGHEVFVLYLHKDTTSIIQDENYNFVYYLPRLSIGLHGIFNVKLLEEFNPEKIIMFSDNQMWAKNVIDWCENNNVSCIHYMGAVLSDNRNFLNQFYTKIILFRNRKSYNYSINIGKTKKVQYEMKRLNIPDYGVINVGLDESILHNQTNPDYEIRRKLGYKECEKIILFVGRIVDYKKPFLAVDILKKLIDKSDKYKMIMIGKGELKPQVVEYIQSNGLSDKIQIIERVPYEEMYKYMVSSDCFINLSSIEIFGMAILEAMYYQLPVVAHIAPGPSEIINHPVNGYLLETNDPAVWANYISQAINKSKDIGKASRESIENRYTWDVIADDFLRILYN